MRYITQSERVRMLQQENNALKARAHQIESAANIIFVKMAERGEIDEQTALEHIDIFSPWHANEDYKEGEYRKHDGALYICLQDLQKVKGHMTPDKAAHHWKKVGDSTEFNPKWSKPICEIDGYSIGDCVTYDSKIWRSTSNKNVTTPGIGNWAKTE